MSYPVSLDQHSIPSLSMLYLSNQYEVIGLFINKPYIEVSVMIIELFLMLIIIFFATSQITLLDLLTSTNSLIFLMSDSLWLPRWLV
jgi:hypothetical protein